MPNRHLAELVLMEYAGGALREPMALVVATHLALCPRCRDRVADIEAACGAFLEEEEGRSVSPACLDGILARLDESPPQQPSCPAVDQPRAPEMPLIPEPLRGYLGGPLATLPWRLVAEGTERADIAVGRAPTQVFLLRMAAGVAAPLHSHQGIEMNLVLCGRFHDERGAHDRGDVIIDDATVEHRPMADAKEGCLCLCLTNAPLRLTGGLAGGLRRLLEPFARR